MVRDGHGGDAGRIGAWLLLFAMIIGWTEPPVLRAQEPVRYTISFDNRVHHEAQVEIRYSDINPGPLEVRMSRTSPGRYALHEFAKNVYDFTATDADGNAVTIERPDPHQWTIVDHGGEVTVRYTLFADHADGTYAGIDATHAHLNAPATFAWARGLVARPVELTVRIPDGSGWQVATQLGPTADPTVFTAPDHAYFLDSPLEIADLDMREWTVGGQTVRIAMHHEGTASELDRYEEATRAIVEQEAAVFGEMPTFDFGTYTFLACYVPWADGDGMEHRNSTVLTSTGSLANNMVGLLGTVAHEFFHAWSIERIRPETLEPFDFEAANMSRELWFGEGFTSYYDDVALVRGGVIDQATFAQRMGGTVNAVVNGPGRRYFSPVEMSMQAPFVDAAVSVDPVNRSNTFISYYTWGAAVALGLDLTIRTRFDGLTLDDVMREMWVRHGQVERPYGVDEIEAALAAVTEDTAFAADYFDRYIRGSEVPDYEALLAAAGIVLSPARPDTPLLGRTALAPHDDGLRVAGSALVGEPLYEAGIDRGDVLLSMDGRSLRGAQAQTLLFDARPGETVELEVRSRGTTRTVRATLAADPTLAAATLESAGGRPSTDQAAFREAWLSAR